MYYEQREMNYISGILICPGAAGLTPTTSSLQTLPAAVRNQI